MKTGDPSWWAGILVGMQGLGDRWRGLQETTRAATVIVGASGALLSAGMSVGLLWANWQGTPAVAESALDSTGVIRADLDRYIEQRAEPAFEDLEATRRRVDSLNREISRVQSAIGVVHDSISTVRRISLENNCLIKVLAGEESRFNCTQIQ